jgi:hypothetical protein
VTVRHVIFRAQSRGQHGARPRQVAERDREGERDTPACRPPGYRSRSHHDPQRRPASSELSAVKLRTPLVVVGAYLAFQQRPLASLSRLA